MRACPFARVEADDLAGKNVRNGWEKTMTIHKNILEWQAAHPNITWIGWSIIWAIVLAILLWPRRSG